MTTTDSSGLDSELPRAVQNGMSMEEYHTWMFLADKEAGTEPYTYVIKQSDLTAFIRSSEVATRIDELQRLLMIGGVNIQVNDYAVDRIKSLKEAKLL